MDEILQKPLSWLRQHPKNKAVFDSSPKEFQGILASIADHGVQEPIITKEDGTILSGHLRYFAVLHIATEKAKAEGLSEPDLTKVMVPVRVHPAFKSEYDEFRYLVEANLKRRQLTPDEVAMAYKVLHEARAKEDRRKLPKEAKGASKGRRISAREQSAGSLNISVRSGDAHELIFTTEGVPEEVKKLARTKEVSIVRAGEAVKAHLVDGKINDPDKLIEAVKALTVRSGKPLRMRLVGNSKLTARATLSSVIKSAPMHEQITDVDNALEAVLAEGTMTDEAATRGGLTSILNRVKAFLVGMGWSEAVKTPEPPKALAVVEEESIFTVPEEKPIPPTDDDFGDLLKSL